MPVTSHEISVLNKLKGTIATALQLTVCSYYNWRLTREYSLESLGDFPQKTPASKYDFIVSLKTVHQTIGQCFIDLK
jgi:hypothetical protein